MDFTMKGPTLAIMAAGLGSRYGGMKQLDPIGPNGEIIVDYSVFDAKKAGFEKVVFIVRKELLSAFRESIGQRIEGQIETRYVLQEPENLPDGFSAPPERSKPWGTAHAVLCCEREIDGPFAVINADDFYGPGAFSLLYRFLTKPAVPDGKYHYGMVGYMLENTLTENGSVSRGICEISKEGFLESLCERTHIMRRNGTVQDTEDGSVWITLKPGSVVSMNCWGFEPDIFDEIRAGIPGFFEHNRGNLLKAEYFLPDVVNSLLARGKADVKVLRTDEKWFGVTYHEDKEAVTAAVRRMTAENKYPERLWK